MGFRQNFGGMPRIGSADGAEYCRIRDAFMGALRQYGYRETPLPIFDCADRYILNGDCLGAQSHYKTIAPNGEVYSLRRDLVAALASLGATEVSGLVRLCAFGQEANFLPRDGESANRFCCAATCLGRTGVGDEADLIAAGALAAARIGIENVGVAVGNTDVFRGALKAYGKGDDGLERLRNILSNRIESDSDYAVFQTLEPYKDLVGKGALANDLSAKLDNKLSLNGLVDAFETCNRLEACGVTNVVFKPGYLGSRAYDNGLVFEILDSDGRAVATGGRCDCAKDGKELCCIYLHCDLDSARRAASGRKIAPGAEPERELVTMCLAPTETAVAKGLSMRRTMLCEGLRINTIYGADKTEAYAMMRDASAGMVVYVDEDGEIRHG